MKQHWTRIAAMIDRGVDTRFHEQIFQNLFMRHHRHACEIHTDSSGTVMAAVYFSPMAKNKEQTKAIFREIQKRTNYACEESTE